MDIFPAKAKKPTPKPTRPVQRTPAWRSLLPMRTTTRGKPVSDPQRVEDMIAALTGLPADRGRDEELFVDTVSSTLTDGILSLRVFELHDEAPARVPGKARLSSRSQQHVRAVLGQGEARGRARFPFRVTVAKELPESALQHATLIVQQGFDLALVPDALHRSSAEHWPALDSRHWGRAGAPQERGCPLVVGDADARSSWHHLSESGALAVWPTGSRQLWVFKVVPGGRFPTPFTLAELRRRAAGL